MSAPRIVTGSLKNRRLAVVEGTEVRPTALRVREALFDILASRDRIENATVLDLFAGTGAIGIEALSRGASFVTFVEADRAAARAIGDNLERFGEAKRARVIAGDATRLGRPSMPFDLVYLDPPYGSDLGAKALRALTAEGWLAEGALLVWETPSTTPVPGVEGYALADERRYGAARLLFLERG